MQPACRLRGHVAAIGSDELVRSVVTAVVIPDQGAIRSATRRGSSRPSGARDRLRIIDQPNLGGSGGYARVLYEALETPTVSRSSSWTTTSSGSLIRFLRAVAFSRFARQPMLVGR